MENLVSIIINYASIWAPSLTAIAGVITMACTAMSKVSESIENSKKAIEELKNSEEIKKLKDELRRQTNVNNELKEQLDLLIDHIEKVDNYRDNIKR